MSNLTEYIIEVKTVEMRDEVIRLVNPVGYVNSTEKTDRIVSFFAMDPMSVQYMHHVLRRYINYCIGHRQKPKAFAIIYKSATGEVQDGTDMNANVMVNAIRAVSDGTLNPHIQVIEKLGTWRKVTESLDYNPANIGENPGVEARIDQLALEEKARRGLKAIQETRFQL